MSGLRPCRTAGCGSLVAADAYRGRCADCASDHDRKRGTSGQRGYGARHQAQRKQIQQAINSGMRVTCWRCGADIVGRHWHLGHDDADRTITRGAECVACNLSAAGRASHNQDVRPDTPRG